MDRIEDQLLRDHFSSQRCLICNNPPPNDGHHVKSRGSGGHDIAVNLVTLCRRHHTELHQYGINKFIQVYPKFLPVLSEKGWYRQTIGEGRNAVEKWFHDEVRS